MSIMDFRSAGDRVRSLVAAKKPQELARSVLTEDELRDNVIRESAENLERFQRAQDRIPEIKYTDPESGETRTHEWGSFPSMLRDVARANWQLDEPELRQRDAVRPSHQLNREVMANYLASEGFAESRPYTAGNELEAWYGAIAAQESLELAAKDKLAEHIARAEEMEQAEQDIADAQDMLEQLRDQARQERAEHGEPLDATTIEAMRQQAKLAGARQELLDLLQAQAGSTFAGDCYEAAQTAAKAGAEAADALRNLPGMEPGQAHNVPPEKQIELAERWAANELLRKVARECGRMLRSMTFTRETRSKNVPIEPVGITTGRDIDRLVPHEMARAFDPTQRILWIKDYSGHALLQFEYEGKEPAGKGPVITVTDGSGSMSGEKFIWAASLALALLTIAHREKRAFAGVEFGSPGQVASWIFPAHEDLDPERVIDFTSHFFGGGTSIVSGIHEAATILHEQEEFKTADIVVISDGQDSYAAEDEKLRDELRAEGVRLHGLSILARGNHYLNEMCDYVLDVLDLAGANEVTDSLATNIT